MSAGANARWAITTGREVRFRPPTPTDGRELWRLARAVGLDVNSPYAYVLWADHFADASIVAVAPGRAGDQGEPGEQGERGEHLVGFVTGFRPAREPATLFVWQIGVAAETRHQGLGRAMLDELLARTRACWLEATVTPSNAASAALFRGTAARHGTGLDETVAYPAELFPDGHEPEVRFRVGPIGPAGPVDAIAATTDR